MKALKFGKNCIVMEKMLKKGERSSDESTKGRGRREWLSEWSEMTENEHRQEDRKRRKE